MPHIVILPDTFVKKLYTLSKNSISLNNIPPLTTGKGHPITSTLHITFSHLSNPPTTTLPNRRIHLLTPKLTRLGFRAAASSLLVKIHYAEETTSKMFHRRWPNVKMQLNDRKANTQSDRYAAGGKVVHYAVNLFLTLYKLSLLGRRPDYFHTKIRIDTPCKYTGNVRTYLRLAVTKIYCSLSETKWRLFDSYLHWLHYVLELPQPWFSIVLNK